MEARGFIQRMYNLVKEITICWDLDLQSYNSKDAITSSNLVLSHNNNLIDFFISVCYNSDFTGG